MGDPIADMTAAIIRLLWPVSFVLLSEAVSRNERRLLRLRCQGAVHRKFLSLSLSLVLFVATKFLGTDAGKENSSYYDEKEKRKF